MIKKHLATYLGWCAKRAIRFSVPTIVAVAGSVGKSSTKEAVGVALGSRAASEHVRATSKNYNNEFGVPFTVFGCAAPGTSVFAWLSILSKAFVYACGLSKIDARILVLEMGTDHPGDLAHLLNIAPPKVSVLTAIGPEHTEYFGSIEAVADEEAGVLQALAVDGVAVVNADDNRVLVKAAMLPCRVLTFGFSPESTARILETRVHIDTEQIDRSGLEVKLTMYGTTHCMHFPGFIGRPQAYAAAAALAVVGALDIDDKVAVSRLQESYRGMPGRMRLIPGIKKTWIIDDTYNASPLAALSALRDLASFPVEEGGRRIAALGDMLELGKLAERAHIDMGRQAAEAGVDMLVVCGTLAHAVEHAAIEAGLSQDQVFVLRSSEEVGRFIQERLKSKDVVLVKGSQGVRMERIVKELMADPLRATELLVRQTKEWTS